MINAFKGAERTQEERKEAGRDKDREGLLNTRTEINACLPAVGFLKSEWQGEVMRTLQARASIPF
jgi:hypothetical protein